MKEIVTYTYIIKKIDLLLTICYTDGEKCIKIEEVIIDTVYRKKGIYTEMINIMKGIALDHNVKVGLWSKIDNKRLFDFYIRLGFKHVETLDDYWLEFN